MRIGIDARYLSHKVIGGVHNTIKALLAVLPEEGTEHEFIYYADHKAPFEIETLPGNARLKLLPWKNPLYSSWNDVTFGRQTAADHLDVIHFPANYGFGPRGVPRLVTLHDEINILPWKKIISGHRHNARTITMMTYLHLFSTWSLKNADWVVTVSDYSRRQIAHFSQFPIDRISVVYNAVGEDVQPVTDPARIADVRQRLGIKGRFLLADALKNPDVLLKAWELLPPDLRKDYEIVFFCRFVKAPESVESAAAKGQARLLVQPARKDLLTLFSQAEIFVFPSWLEGFGIPLVEAMTCGAPVIASDRGAIPEVAGGAALIIDAEDARGLAECIQKILTCPEEQASLKRKGFERAKCFSWRQSARELLQVYTNLAGRSR